MKITKYIIIVFVILCVANGISAGFLEGPYRNLTCGRDTSPISVVYEGVASIHTYPWMGFLFYPMRNKRFTTALILVTKQIALGTASEIDKLPKVDFRARSLAVFGHDCSGPTVPIRDYNYHPEYASNTYSALALVQLETDDIMIDLQPICPPPTYFVEPELYAMTVVGPSKKPVVKLYEMMYVNPDDCKMFYRKSGLDIRSMWPTHTACAKAKTGGECLWTSGAALVLRQGGIWRLLGFGVYGPGCGAPARFLDYGVFQQWVRRSVVNIGKPTITRLAQNEVVMRRTLSSLQRYGPCDPEEMSDEIYTDHTEINVTNRPFALGTVKYNMTIHANVEYSCVTFRAGTYKWHKLPQLRLRRWCAGAVAMCTDFQNIDIDFFVEIIFKGNLMYDMKAYGREPQSIDEIRAMKYVNERRKKPPVIDSP